MIYITHKTQVYELRCNSAEFHITIRTKATTAIDKKIITRIVNRIDASQIKTNVK